jgi:hypothetical protein
MKISGRGFIKGSLYSSNEGGRAFLNANLFEGGRVRFYLS